MKEGQNKNDVTWRVKASNTRSESTAVRHLEDLRYWSGEVGKYVLDGLRSVPMTTRHVTIFESVVVKMLGIEHGTRHRTEVGHLLGLIDNDCRRGGLKRG